jgi:hypothetical protein
MPMFDEQLLFNASFAQANNWADMPQRVLGNASLQTHTRVYMCMEIKQTYVNTDDVGHVLNGCE